MRKLAMSLVGTCLIACGGVPQNKVKRITTTTEQGPSGSVVISIEVQDNTYKGDKLETVEITTDGTLEMTLAFTYNKEDIASITGHDPEDVELFTNEFEYKDGLLTKRVETAPGSEDTATLEVEYDDELIDTITATSSANPDARSTSTYTYDDDDRVEKITESNGDESYVSTYSWDEDDHSLKSIKFSGGNDEYTTSFRYDDDGRVESISLSPTSYKITYGDDGLIETIVVQQTGGGFKQTIEYEYDDGDSEGFIPTGRYPSASHFDIEGAPLESKHYGLFTEGWVSVN